MILKKILMYIGIILGLNLVIFLGWLVMGNKREKNKIIEEITPQEEISDEQLRQTIVTLYFLDKQTGGLQPEARQIDARMLLDNPYQILINMLIEGPKNEQLLGLFPQGTKINNVEIKEGIVYINFSKEFINEQKLGEEQEMKIINSILKTLLELSEVNGIKILIDGEENMCFPDEAVKFNEVFYLE